MSRSHPHLPLAEANTLLCPRAMKEGGHQAEGLTSLLRVLYLSPAQAGSIRGEEQRACSSSHELTQTGGTFGEEERSTGRIRPDFFLVSMPREALQPDLSQRVRL